MVKNLLAMQETQVRSFESGRSLEKGLATHSSILADFLCSFPSSLLADAVAFCFIAKIESAETTPHVDPVLYSPFTS